MSSNLGSDPFLQSTASLHSDLPLSSHQPINRALPYIPSFLIYAIIWKKRIYRYFCYIITIVTFSSFSHLHVVCIFASVEHKIRYFEKSFNCFEHTLNVNVKKNRQFSEYPLLCSTEDSHTGLEQLVNHDKIL